jgi:hypothetical protein
MVDKVSQDTSYDGNEKTPHPDFFRFFVSPNLRCWFGCSGEIFDWILSKINDSDF